VLAGCLINKRPLPRLVAASEDKAHDATTHAGTRLLHMHALPPGLLSGATAKGHANVNCSSSSSTDPRVMPLGWQSRVYTVTASIISSHAAFKRRPATNWHAKHTDPHTGSQRWRQVWAIITAAWCQSGAKPVIGRCR
jgi:hypothetical protein